MTQRGFTLIELVVIVAIVGILSAIAIPQFTEYRIRARRTEVRTNMSAILHAQTAHHNEHHTYTDDLSRLGWAPSGSPRFIYGFTSDAIPAASGLNDTAELRANGGGQFSTSSMIDAFGNPLVQGDLPAATVSKDRFRVAAAANFDTDATLDQWILDSNDNTIVHVTDDLEQ